MARIAAVLLLLIAAAPAPAQSVDQTLTEGAREQSCRALASGSGGTPDETAADPAGDLPAAWPAAPEGLLPARVDLRTPTESFNRIYDFAVRGGNLYARRKGMEWRAMPMPPCIDGRLASISADDDELIALDVARRVYTLDNVLKDGALWNWTSRWGTPTWLGPGLQLPDSVLAWSWTVISKVEDGSWLDPAGNRTPIGDGKVSHIWGLRTGGQRLTFWDPWLALDDSYEACGPHRGRFRAVNLSTSGSQLFVIGARGDMFTRLYDFDISGHDPVFFKYSYENQRGKGDGAPIQLPAAPWVQQPKIPGAITDAISIHKVGFLSIHRILRVEGSKDGATGYWERDIASPVSAGWTFVATGRTLVGHPLRNPQRDTSKVGLGPGEDHRYVMRSPDGTRAELENYNVYCSPARLKVTKADGTVERLTLHHVDGLRQEVRGRGLDDQPRTQIGAIEHPDGTFESTLVQATRKQIVIEAPGWTFTRAPDRPRCLAAGAKLGAARLGPLWLGLRRAAAARLSPVEHAGSAWRWCVRGGGRVTGVFSAGRLALLVSTAPGHRAGAKPTGEQVLPGVLRTTPRGRTLVRVRHGRVVWVALAQRGVINRPAKLRALLAAVTG